MDKRTMSIWNEKVYRPLVASHTGDSGLLLYQIKCHRIPQLLLCMEDDNAMRYMISPH